MQGKPERPERENEKSGSIKVDPNRLESLLELIGEMVVIKSQLSHNRTISDSVDPELQSLVGLFDRTLRDLQDRTLSLRLTSLKPTFVKVQRAVRDLSLKLGKSVDFSLEGEETEIDRGLIEALIDPLLHLARNALDHGVETDDERAKAGKPTPAKICLSARQSGGRIVIEMKDDGRGISRAAVIKKAQENGLIAEGAAKEMPDRQILDLLFEPGFSTAQKVTEVSGRGVGLDVVRSQVEKVRGFVDVESAEGEGTRFTISLPLTTAITDGLLASVKGVKYILPLSGVREIARPARADLTRLDDETRVIQLRGKFVPVVDLRFALGFEASGAEEDLGIESRIAVIIEHLGGWVALLVDEVIGQTQVVVKALSKSVHRTDGLTGGAILGDGSVALVLDLDGIVREHHRNLNADGRRKAA